MPARFTGQAVFVHAHGTRTNCGSGRPRNQSGCCPLPRFSGQQLKTVAQNGGCSIRDGFKKSNASGRRFARASPLAGASTTHLLLAPPGGDIENEDRSRPITTMRATATRSRYVAVPGFFLALARCCARAVRDESQAVESIRVRHRTDCFCDCAQRVSRGDDSSTPDCSTRAAGIAIILNSSQRSLPAPGWKTNRAMDRRSQT